MKRRFQPYVLAAAALAASCDERPTPPERPRAPPARPASAWRPPSAEETENVAALDAGGGGRPAVIARCVERNRRSLSPEVAGALAALDPEAFLEDACRLDLAVRARAPSLCDGVRTSALREPCLVRSAMVTGAPERCPAALGLRVRDPVCVAVAARDARLCAAAAPAERVRCLAIARNDPRVCERLDPILRPDCARDLGALAGALPVLRGDPLPDGSATLTVERGNEAPRDGATEGARVFTLRALQRGLTLDEGGTLWVVDPALGWPRESLLDPDAPRVGVRIPTAGIDAGMELSVDARIELPGLLALDTAQGNARAVARCARLPRSRGDALACEVTLEGARLGLGWRCTLRVETFVRDIVPASFLR